MFKSQSPLILITFSAFISTTIFFRKKHKTNSDGDNIIATTQQYRRSLTDWFHNIDPKTVQLKNGSRRPGYLRAFLASHGFFYDIPDEEWENIMDIAKERQQYQHRYSNPKQQRGAPQRFYQENWEPNFSCRFEQRIGVMGDGGKWVCDPHRIKMLSSIRKTSSGKDDPCLVYSIGSGGDFSFEYRLMNALGEDECEIHTFEVKGKDQFNYEDETDEQRRKTAKINVHYNWGLMSSNNEAQPGFKTLSQTIKELGHEGRTIDIFKIDCEGCEWRTYQDWINAPALLHQVLVEVHRNPENSNSMFEAMQEAGYVIFHKEPNIQYGGGQCVEYGFLKLDRNVL